MEISREHGYHKHYVLIKSEGLPSAEYALKILEANPIPGFLPVQKRKTAGGIVYAYEITGQESLKKRWQVCPVGYRDMKDVLVQLTEIIKLGEEYLLSSDKLLLEAEEIFWQNGKMSLCYYPEKQTGFYEALRGFVEQMLKEVNHKDVQGVAFAYGLYEACQSDTFVLETYLKESWQCPPEEEKEEETLAVPKPVVAEKGGKTGPWKYLRGRMARKKKEEIREECWREVWKLKGQQEFIVDKSPFIVGKQRKNVDACIENLHVSRVHARLEQEKGLLFLTDLNSTNGSFINGKRIIAGKKEVVSPGDRISFADQIFLLVKEAERPLD